MHKDSILIISSLLNEIKNLNCHLVEVIKEQLTVVIKPVKCQILHTNLGPLILELPPCTVDDVRDLVDCKELKVLRRILVSQEQPILNLHCTEDILRFDHG